MALGFPSGKNGSNLPCEHVEPHFGSRLLPQVVDELARSSPERIYASVPIHSNPLQGLRDVTILELAQAVSHFAWWLDEHLGKSTSFETLAYVGLSDLRYVVVFLAAVKCGYKVSGEGSEHTGRCVSSDIFSSFYHHCGTLPQRAFLFWNRLNAQKFSVPLKWHKRSMTCKLKCLISKPSMFQHWMINFTGMQNIIRTKRPLRMLNGIQWSFFSLQALQVNSTLLKLIED